MNTIINTDVFYPPGACTSSSNYATGTGAVGAGGHVTINTLGTGGSSGVEYLASTLFNPIFKDLWEIRSRF
jgi:hypothetical protein